MGEQLMPDNLASTIADFHRRIQILEATRRVGMSGTRNAQSSAVALAGTFGSWEYSPATYTSVDDTNTTFPGYPQLTMTLPQLFMVTFGGRLEGLANVATSRSKAGTLGVGIDGADGTLTAGITFQTNAANCDVPQSTSAVLRLPPGNHVLKLGVFWENTVPGGVNLPRLSNAFLIVTPISAA